MSKIILLLIFTFCNYPYFVVAKDLKSVIEYALIHNKELKLAQLNLDIINFEKTDIFVEFLPDIKLNYQRGVQKNNVRGIDRGILDQSQDQEVKEISLNQPIFNGFKSVNKAKKISNSLAEGKYLFETSKDEIILKIISSYLKLSLSREITELRESNKTLSKQIFEIVKKRNQAGEISRSEVILYDSKFMNSLNGVLMSKKDLFMAETIYEQVVGKLDANLESQNYKNLLINQDQETLTKIFKQNNTKLKAYQHKILKNKAVIRANIGELLPKANLAFTHNIQDNVVYLNNRNLETTAIYLNVTIPIFRKGKNYFNISKSKKDLTFAKQEYNLEFANLSSQVKLLYQQYQFYQKLLISQMELFKLSQENLSKLNEQVETGEGDIIDLLNAKFDKNILQEDLLKTKIDFIKNYYELTIITGLFKI